MRSRSLLLKHREKLSQEDCLTLDVMLRFSDKPAQTYTLKGSFFSFMDSPDKNTARQRLECFLDACDRLKLYEFNACRRMLKNW